MNIYVASSWRNNHQPAVVDWLRGLGHEVYDFRNPKPGYQGFHWSEIDRAWQDWDLIQYLNGLHHALADEGFEHDFNAMKAADCCVLVLPCGRSAHLEAGWFVGREKLLIVFIVGRVESELMYKMADGVCGGDTLGIALIELRKMLGCLEKIASQP